MPEAELEGLTGGVIEANEATKLEAELEAMAEPKFEMSLKHTHRA